MSKRQVTSVGVDSAGYVVWLAHAGEDWSPQHTRDVIFDLELGIHSYYVQWPEKTTDIDVVDDAGGRYLRTDRDDSPHNNLTDLPEL